MKLNFNCRPTLIGSVPYTDPAVACAKVGKYLPDFPAWPQLPRRSNLENMYAQYSEGFPGIVINGQKISLKRNPGFDEHLEQIFLDYSESKIDKYFIGKDYAAGLHAFSSLGRSASEIVKGQITGPISWGLCVTDDAGRGIIYDDVLSDAIAKFLKLKVAWQENFLRNVAHQTIIFIDEPYLASLGSAFIAISGEEVSSLLEEVLSGIQGIKGIHCCGGTDWSLLLKLHIDILSFDAYSDTDSLLCYAEDVKRFLGRGGAIAWGIIPNDEDTLKKESLSSLYDRFGEALAPYTRGGISIKEIISKSLITPTCGLASLSNEAAEEVLKLLVELSRMINKKYVH